MDKEKYEKALFKLANEPKEEDLKGIRILGIPAVKCTKKMLLYGILHLLREQRKLRDRHKNDVEFLTSISTAQFNRR